jgi:hypothetical protein
MTFVSESLLWITDIKLKVQYYNGHKELRAASLPRRAEEIKKLRCKCTYECDV